MGKRTRRPRIATAWLPIDCDMHVLVGKQLSDRQIREIVAAQKKTLGNAAPNGPALLVRSKFAVGLAAASRLDVSLLDPTGRAAVAVFLAEEHEIDLPSRTTLGLKISADKATTGAALGWALIEKQGQGPIVVERRV